MLTCLYVENIAIIKKVSVDFSNGLTILSGETGAGKSILIDSIGLLLGNKSRRELIGPFGEYSYVRAEFDCLSDAAVSLLRDNEIDASDCKAFVERKISKDGKSRAKINGIPVSAATLQSLAPYLINIHGQHDHVQILNSSIHIDLLDRFACLENEIFEYRTEYDALRALRARLVELQQSLEKRDAEQSALIFELEEFQSVQPYIGMHDDLLSRRKILQNQEQIQSFLALLAPDDEHSVSQVLQDLTSSAEKLIDIDSRFKLIYESLDAMQQLCTDVSLRSEDIASGMDGTETLDDIETQLYKLEKLLAKYGPKEEDLLAAWQQLEQKSELASTLEEQIEKAKEDYVAQLSLVQKMAQHISEQRHKSAAELSRLVCGELAYLDMAGVSFEVNVESNLNAKGGFVYNAKGHDKVEFLLSSNAGQPLRPLSKIASGGELSRIMLSLTNVLNVQQDVGTLIFDEVDTGVSGKTAEKVGNKLYEVSRQKQVLCITHLAQIASLGDNHYKIIKSVVDGQTETSVNLLSEDERIEEISRIIGGITITDTIRNTAKEMLKHK